MKKGDKLRLDIEGTPVGMAEIEHIGETQVTIFIPAQRVIAQKRTTLDLAPEVKEPETQTIVEGVDRVGTAEAVEAPVSDVNSSEVQTPSDNTAEQAQPATEPVAVTSEDVQEVSGEESQEGGT